ncbi:hypothetical protein IFM89_021036, partial [Coptis chinensis]
SRNIPPHDTIADTPERAYPLDQIILSAEWDHLLNILEHMQSGTKISPDAYPSYVCNRIDKLMEIKLFAHRKLLLAMELLFSCYAESYPVRCSNWNFTEKSLHTSQSNFCLTRSVQVVCGRLNPKRGSLRFWELDHQNYSKKKNYNQREVSKLYGSTNLDVIVGNEDMGNILDREESYPKVLVPCLPDETTGDSGCPVSSCFWEWKPKFNVHYEKSGSENVNASSVLLPGFGVGSFHYEKHLKDFGREYRVWAVDFLGQGMALPVEDPAPLAEDSASGEMDLVWGFGEQAEPWENELVYSIDLWRDQVHHFVEEFGVRLAKSLSHPSSPAATTSLQELANRHKGVAKVVLKKGKVQLFQDRIPMVYSGVVDRIIGRPPPKTGDVVLVADGTEKPIGWGVYNSVSMFCVHLMQLEGDAARDPSLALSMEQLLQTRIDAAIELRRFLGLPSTHTNAYCLVNSEGDRLSGLIVDVFEDLDVIASSTAWVEKYKPEEALELSDLDGSHLSLSLETVEVLENGISYSISLDGQKTGFYADQRDNRQFISSIVQGQNVLDMCCYSGGHRQFIACFGACNGKYRSKDLQGASGMYRNLNSLAIQVTKRGGLLMTCSCSGAMTQSGMFLRVLQARCRLNGRLAGRKVTVFRQSGAACGHPNDPSYPEGAYLSNILLRVAVFSRCIQWQCTQY